MEKIVQLLTNNETDAYKAVEILQSLDAKGSLSLSEYVVIEKDENGKASLKKDSTNTLLGTAVGGTTGALLGSLFGPYGLLLGSSFGSLMGLTVDGIDALNTDDVLEKVSKDMPNGKVVVVAHIFEQWEAGLDSSIGDLAEITRVDVDEQISKAIQADIDSLDKDISDTEETIKNSVGEAKEKAHKKLDDLKDKRDEKQKKLNKKMKAQQSAYKQWLKKTQDKLKSTFS